MLYRILTESKNKAAVVALTLRHFDSFSLFDATGYWQSQGEQSLVIEVETDDLEGVVATASAIKAHNAQDAVLIQQIPNHAWLI